MERSKFARGTLESLVMFLKYEGASPEHIKMAEKVLGQETFMVEQERRPILDWVVAKIDEFFKKEEKGK